MPIRRYSAKSEKSGKSVLSKAWELQRAQWESCSPEGQPEHRHHHFWHQRCGQKVSPPANQLVWADQQNINHSRKGKPLFQMCCFHKWVVGQFGTRQFGIRIIWHRTIWHQDSKNGQFGTKIVKTDNLAPGQFCTNIKKRTKMLYNVKSYNMKCIMSNCWQTKFSKLCQLFGAKKSVF